MIVDPFLFSSRADPKTSVPDRTSPSAKEEKNNNNDEKCLGIHELRPFQCLDAVSASFEATHSRLPSHRIAVGDRLGNYSTTN